MLTASAAMPVAAFLLSRFVAKLLQFIGQFSYSSVLLLVRFLAVHGVLCLSA
jgi:hypothetical protein